MERRVLLAVVLSFVVLFAYQALVVKPNSKPAVPTASATTPAAATATPVEAPAAPPVPTGPLPAVLTGETAEREIVLETSRVKATFSNRGAILESWLLKDYLDSSGRPMDMVAPALTTPDLHPLSMTVGDAALSARLNTALYQASSGDQKLDTRTGTSTVTRALFRRHAFSGRPLRRFKQNQKVPILQILQGNDLKIHPFRRSPVLSHPDPLLPHRLMVAFRLVNRRPQRHHQSFACHLQQVKARLPCRRSPRRPRRRRSGTGFGACWHCTLLHRADLHVNVEVRSPAVRAAPAPG